MKKEIFAFVVVLFFSSLQFTSCSHHTKPKIGVLFHKLAGTDWEKDSKYFTEKAEALGAEVITKNADKNELLQYQQAMELIKQDVDILVIVAQNVNAAAAIVRKAKEHNIKVIAYRRMIKNANLDYFMGFDLYKCGKLQAGYALENSPPHANFILLEGDYSDENAQLIMKAHANELDKKIKEGSINIVYKSFCDNWSPVEAAFEFQKALILSGQQINTVIAANDNIAEGVINELDKNAIRNEVIITGMDLNITAYKRIVNGQQGMSIYKPIRELAEKTATLAVAMAKNENIDYQFIEVTNGKMGIKSLLLGPILIDKNNIEEIIIKGGVFTNEEINN